MLLCCCLHNKIQRRGEKQLPSTNHVVSIAHESGCTVYKVLPPKGSQCPRFSKHPVGREQQIIFVKHYNGAIIIVKVSGHCPSFKEFMIDYTFLRLASSLCPSCTSLPRGGTADVSQYIWLCSKSFLHKITAYKLSN